MIIIKNQYILRNFVGAWKLGRKDPSCKESDHYGDWVRKTVNGIVQERQAGQGGPGYRGVAG